MEAQKESSEGEDIPSDFFDDFAKDDFIEGLSVIDTWDNDDNKQESARVELDSVQDLRELITRERREEEDPGVAGRRRSLSQTLDDFIKPGSRRDPNKTNRAIKKDKELKVKEYLAKSLESSADLRPPGTELDDFFEENKSMKKMAQDVEERNPSPPTQDNSSNHSPHKIRREPKYSPPRSRRSPLLRHRISPGRYRTSPGKLRESPGRFLEPKGRFLEPKGRYQDFSGRFHMSPGRYRYPPGRIRDSTGRPHDHLARRHESPTRSDRRFVSSTYRRSPPNRHYIHSRHGSGHRSRSPNDFSGFRKERRYSSPRGSPIRSSRRERSPRQSYRRSRSPSPTHKRDDFLYPDTPAPTYIAPNPTYDIQPQPYPTPMNMDYYVEPSGGPLNTIVPQVPQPYNLPQVGAYPGFNVPYPYANQPPQPVPAPIIPASVNSIVAPVLHSPQLLISPVHTNTTTPQTGPRTASDNVATEPADALAKLVADGILSHEDYLKLAPNKGAIQQMDSNTRVGVLNRCHSALSKLGDLLPPNRLVIGSLKKPEKMRSIAPKFCSPLKKKPTVEFNFTKVSVSGVALHNQQIIDTIVSTLELHNIVGRPKKNLPSNMRDVAVQTSNPQCDLCVVRKATLSNEVGTSIDSEHFSSTTHTQVMEEDLQKSKLAFNPPGSSSNGAPMSLAHMTPAQLVSQLVARAKTLRETDTQSSQQYQGRDRYDGRGGSQNYRNNYNNYRY